MPTGFAIAIFANNIEPATAAVSKALLILINDFSRG
jgi:hypothetical protein